MHHAISDYNGVSFQVASNFLKSIRHKLFEAQSISADPMERPLQQNKLEQQNSRAL